MKHIISIITFLIIASSVTAQVKFTQLERAATQWSVPVAKRTIPGISDYVMTYMTLAQLIDSTETILGTRIDSMKMTTNDTLALYTSDGVFKAKIIITEVDGDPTNELQEITIDDDNKLILSINNSNVSIDHLSENDSTLVGDTPMLDLTMTGKTITGIPDTLTYLATQYGISQKQNLITGTSGQTLRFSATNTLTANSLLYNDGSGVGINTTSLGSDKLSVSGNTNLNGYLRINGGSNIWIQNSTIAIPTDAGTQNTVIGFNVGNPSGMSGAINNFLLGTNAALGLTTGDANVAIGQGVISGITSGSNNVVIGDNALNGASNTSSVVAVGNNAGKDATSTFGGGYFGSGAGQGTSAYCFAFGEQALRNNTGANSNAFGALAGYGNTGANSNFFGFKAGMGNTRNYSLYIDNDETFVPLIGGQFDNNRVGINTNINSIDHTLTVTGTAKITGSSGTGTSLMLRNGDGAVSAGTLSTGLSIVSGALTLTETGDISAVTVTAPILGGGTSGSVNIAADTTSATLTALVNQRQLSTKISGSGTDNYIPRFNGTTAIENSNMYDDGTNIGIGTTSPTAKLSVAGALKVTGSTSGNTRIWGYDHTDGTMGIITIGTGLSLSGDALSATGGTYAYWRLSANGGTAFAVTDNTLVDFNNSTGITWTRDSGTGEMTATLADNSATNEIQNLSYTNATRALGISSGTGVTLPLVSSTIAGLVSAYPNNTTSFLRGDGTWATPPTPAMTATAPILVTSGNISLNYGTGLYSASGSLTNLSTNYGYLFHSSGTIGGQSISTTPLTVNFNDQMQGFNMTCNTTSDYVQVTNSGGYEIDYGICVGGISSTRQISVTVYVGSSSVPGTLKRFFIDSGDEDCAHGKHIMDLTAGQQVFLKVATSGSETATFDGPQLKVTRIY